MRKIFRETKPAQARKTRFCFNGCTCKQHLYNSHWPSSPITIITCLLLRLHFSFALIISVYLSHFASHYLFPWQPWRVLVLDPLCCWHFVSSSKLLLAHRARGAPSMSEDVSTVTLADVGLRPLLPIIFKVPTYINLILNTVLYKSELWLCMVGNFVNLKKIVSLSLSTLIWHVFHFLGRWFNLRKNKLGSPKRWSFYMT